MEEAKQADDTARKRPTQHYSGALKHEGSVRTHRAEQEYRQTPDEDGESTTGIDRISGDQRLPRSESRASGDIQQWDDLWARSNNLGQPIDESNVDEQQRKRNNRGSILISAPPRLQSVSSISSSTLTTTASPVNSAASATAKLRSKKAEQKELYRQQRGIMQFKPMRTLKWMKDGVLLGGHTLSTSSKSRHREPNLSSEI